MADPRAPRPGDIVAGIVLVFVSLIGIIHGFSLDRPSGWSTAPGLLPVALSVLLGVMALTLISSGIRAGAVSSRVERKPRDWLPGIASWFYSHARTLAAMILTAVFYFGLLPILWFEVAAAAFLFAMACFFRTGSSFRQRVALAIAAPIVFVLVFQVCFDLALPGESTLLETALFRLR